MGDKAESLQIAYNIKQSHERKLSDISIFDIYEEVEKLQTFNISEDKITEVVLQTFTVKEQSQVSVEEERPFDIGTIKVYSLPDEYYRVDWT